MAFLALESDIRVSYTLHHKQMNTRGQTDPSIQTGLLPAVLLWLDLDLLLEGSQNLDFLHIFEFIYNKMKRN